MVNCFRGNGEALYWSRSRKVRCAVQLMAELLEARQLLAAPQVAEFGAELASEVPQGPAVVQQQPTGSAMGGIDAGDYYWADEKKVPLLRATSDVVVKLRHGFGYEAVAQEMAGQSSVLAGLEKSLSLSESFITLSGGALQQNGVNQVIAAIERLPQVEWASPSFIYPENGSRLMPTDEIIVSLDDGIDPNRFFGSGFTTYRRLLGTTDQFVATVAAGGGLGALALKQANSPTTTAALV